MSGRKCIVHLVWPTRRARVIIMGALIANVTLVYANQCCPTNYLLHTCSIHSVVGSMEFPSFLSRRLSLTFFLYPYPCICMRDHYDSFFLCLFLVYFSQFSPPLWLTTQLLRFDVFKSSSNEWKNRYFSYRIIFWGVSIQRELKLNKLFEMNWATQCK